MVNSNCETLRWGDQPKSLSIVLLLPYRALSTSRKRPVTWTLIATRFMTLQSVLVLIYPRFSSDSPHKTSQIRRPPHLGHLRHQCTRKLLLNRLLIHKAISEGLGWPITLDLIAAMLAD